MILKEVVDLLGLETINPSRDEMRAITGGYAGDLLSLVMARAGAGNLWITVQTHTNIVAVASLIDLAGIIVAEDAPIENPTIERARNEDVAIYRTPLTSFAVIAKLAQAGIVGS